VTRDAATHGLRDERSVPERVAAQGGLDVTGDGYPGAMRLRSTVDDLSADRARRMLAGLPDARGFEIFVKPLRYREKPHLAAMTDFLERSITLQVPEPFYPFGEIVAYGAKRRPGRGLRFIWLTQGITFGTPREVLRFLYLHEWMHWYLHVHHGRGNSAETTCDRFALNNYRRRTVTIEDALVAMRRTPTEPAGPVGRVAARAPARAPARPRQGGR
jgi:hypothetical protein